MTQAKWTSVSVAAAMFATFAMFAQLANAKSYQSDRELGTIRVESHSGNGTVSGRVRIRNGIKEVQLPGGSWINCFAGCRYTLRTETVDFWQRLEEEGGGAGRN